MKIIYLDVETTGVPCPQSGLIQLSGAIEQDGAVQEEFDFRIKLFPGDAVCDEALSITGVTREELASYEAPEECFEKFINILGKYVDRYNKNDKLHIVAYNAPFDVQHLRAWFEKNGDKYFGSWFWHPAVDVMNMAALALAPSRLRLENFKLLTVARYTGIEFDENLGHDALYDVHITRRLFRCLCGYLGIDPTTVARRGESRGDAPDLETISFPS